MKSKLILLSLAILACVSFTACNKDKDKVNDPLKSTIWTAYDGDDLMVLRFELGTLSSFYIGDKNLNRLGPASGSTYTLTDNTKIAFADLNGSYNNNKYRFKTGTLSGDSMTINYDRWTTATIIDSQKEHLQAVFKKKVENKKK